MSEPVMICTAILPNGKQCGHVMEKFETSKGGFYYICARCGNMRGWKWKMKWKYVEMVI